eukprot:m.117278 g.117278  ORF g.117278 m.117278 type:complete len:58 (-) comp15542_c0_seq3:468-641(-)
MSIFHLTNTPHHQAQAPSIAMADSQMEPEPSWQSVRLSAFKHVSTHTSPFQYDQRNG